MTRRDFYSLSDAELLAQCDVDTYRASGPGGQKRNKTSSAVRLRHSPTGLIVIAEESRSQHENKAKALKRLRKTITVGLREPADESHPDLLAAKNADGRFSLASAKDPRFLPAAGILLDVLSDSQGQVRTAAEKVGTSTANVIAFLELDPVLWQEANRLRAAAGLGPLRPKA
jgi:hypothetical protein